jgi:hypothetical protein
MNVFGLRIHEEGKPIMCHKQRYKSYGIGLEQ